MSDRSLLRISPRKHIDPNRPKDEWTVEVWRDGEVVATIYGSREGVHIFSDRLPANRVFLAEGMGPQPGLVVGLLKEGEICPWCEGKGVIPLPSGNQPCPVCPK